MLKQVNWFQQPHERFLKAHYFFCKMKRQSYFSANWHYIKIMNTLLLSPKKKMILKQMQTMNMVCSLWPQGYVACVSHALLVFTLFGWCTYSGAPIRSISYPESLTLQKQNSMKFSETSAVIERTADRKNFYL